MCVCLSAIISSELYASDLHHFLCVLPMAVARSVNSIILWRCSDTLRISGFMDDVIFAHKPRLLKSPSGCGSEAHTILAAWRVGIPVAGSGRSLYTKVTGQVAAREGAESAVYDCLVYYTVV